MFFILISKNEKQTYFHIVKDLSHPPRKKYANCFHFPHVEYKHLFARVDKIAHKYFEYLRESVICFPLCFYWKPIIESNDHVASAK